MGGEVEISKTGAVETGQTWERHSVNFADLDGNLLISNDLFSGVTVQDGRLCLGEGSGIGVNRL